MVCLIYRQGEVRKHSFDNIVNYLSKNQRLSKDILFFFSYIGRNKSLLRAISSTPFFRGGPFTGAALKYVKKTLFTSLLNGKRKVLFVITHGKSNDDVAIPAATLRRAGVAIISIGVGRAANYAQLKQMAGKRTGAVFTSSFRTLLSIAGSIALKACRGEKKLVCIL